MSVFYITTWDKKPFEPKNTFVGTVDEIFTLAAEAEDCNLKCLEEETRDACNCACGHEIVEDKWHGTIIVPHKESKTKEQLIALSQKIANKEWADVEDDDPTYTVYEA